MTSADHHSEIRHWVDTTAGPIEVREMGTGPSVLLFVHGVLVDSHLWDGVAARAAALGYRCLLPTLPLGAHTRPMNPDADLRPPALADLVADIAAAFEVDRITLVGNDTGGALSQIAAARHPELVRGLVLTSCDAYDHFPPPSLRWLFSLVRAPGTLPLSAFLTRSRRVRGLAVPRLLAHHAPTDEVVQGWTRPLRDKAVRRDIRAVFAGIDTAYTFDAVARLRDRRDPTLLAWGADDRVFGLELGRRLAADIPGSRLEVIDDCAAFVPLDAPARIAELIHGLHIEARPPM